MQLALPRMFLACWDMRPDRGQLSAAGIGYDALPGPALVIAPLPGAFPGTLAGAVVYCVITMRPGSPGALSTT